MDCYLLINTEKETAPNILHDSQEDALYADKAVNGNFDIILTNPPFSVDLDNETKRTLKKSFIYGNKKNSENLFIERWYHYSARMEELQPYCQKTYLIHLIISTL